MNPGQDLNNHAETSLSDKLYIVSILYCILYVFLVSNWHVRSKLLTDYYWV